jgi:uncharacterized protein YjbI with pentapeptide repeats
MARNVWMGDLRKVAVRLLNSGERWLASKAIARTLQAEGRIRRLLPRQRRILTGVILIVGLLILLAFKGGTIWSRTGEAWQWYIGKSEKPSDAIAPLITLLTAVGAGAFALVRHFQTVEADRQRRITENYSKAVEHLSSKEIEQRLGGIYTLERIARESPDDHWTIMETLTAFIRERAKWREPDVNSSERIARRGKPPTDIAAVLTVLARRSKEQLRDEHYFKGPRFLDLSYTDLRGVVLRDGSLRHVDLQGAHLENAILTGIDLSYVFLEDAHLEGAKLTASNLDWAFLSEAHLNGARFEVSSLRYVTFSDADLTKAVLDDCILSQARLHNTNLTGAVISFSIHIPTLTQEQVDEAYGMPKALPPGLVLDKPLKTPAA